MVTLDPPRTRPVWLTGALAGTTAGATATSTKLMPAVAHLIAAAIVIPVVSRRLAAAASGRAWW